MVDYHPYTDTIEVEGTEYSVEDAELYWPDGELDVFREYLRGENLALSVVLSDRLIVPVSFDRSEGVGVLPRW